VVAPSSLKRLGEESPGSTGEDAG